jgi:hypothetical protein
MRLSITVKGELVRKGLQDLGAEIPKVGRQQIRTVLNRIQRRMSKEGKRPEYPIQWDSDKQRKAFFASDGFGRGIPTKRTGEYISGWTIAPITNGYQLQNSATHAQYLGGDAYGVVHSGIHKGRYENLRDVVEDETGKLPDEIENEIQMVARRKGF